jgi:hypothetical protein
MLEALKTTETWTATSKQAVANNQQVNMNESQWQKLETPEVS